MPSVRSAGDWAQVFLNAGQTLYLLFSEPQAHWPSWAKSTAAFEERKTVWLCDNPVSAWAVTRVLLREASFYAAMGKGEICFISGKVVTCLAHACGTGMLSSVFLMHWFFWLLDRGKPWMHLWVMLRLYLYLMFCSLITLLEAFTLEGATLVKKEKDLKVGRVTSHIYFSQ